MTQFYAAKSTFRCIKFSLSAVFFVLSILFCFRFKEITEKFKVGYIAGGSTQNTARVAQVHVTVIETLHQKDYLFSFSVDGWSQKRDNLHGMRWK